MKYAIGLLQVLFLLFGSGCATSPSSAPAPERPNPLRSMDGARRPEKEAEVAPLEAAPFEVGPASHDSTRWESLGPSNYAGKVSDISISATDSNRVVAAYGEGGLWMTRDGGTQWSRIHDPLVRNRISSVNVWAGNHDVIFCGMGYPAHSASPAESGILRSTDAGKTWVGIGPNLVGAEAIYRIEVSPANQNHIWGASPYGIYRTVDGGANWAQTLSFGGPNWWDQLPDLVLHPTNPAILWAAHRSTGIRKSTDAGQTWQNASSGVPATVGAIVLAVSRSNPSILWAVKDDESGNCDILKSVNGGSSWSVVFHPTDYDQGRYDLSVSIDPGDPNRVLVGNVFYYLSTDGSTFTRRNANSSIEDGANDGSPKSPAPHVDHLDFAFAPTNPSVVWSGNDGGMYKSTDGGLNWWKSDHSVRSGKTSDFALDPNSSAIYESAADWAWTFVYDGRQDWRKIRGYEYQFVAVDPRDSDVIYTRVSKIERTTDRGLTWTIVDPDPAGVEPWTYDRPFVFDPADSRTVFTTTNRVYRSSSMGSSWNSISPSLASGAIEDLAISSVDGRRLVSLSDQLWTTLDGGQNWTQIASPPPYMKSVAFAVGDPDSFFVSSAWDVRKYTSFGATSTSIKGNLPSTTTYRKLIVDRSRPGRLFLGTAHGVFMSEDEGLSWEMPGAGLPLMPVESLGLRDGFLYVGGQQGVWRLDLARQDAIVFNDFLDGSGLDLLSDLSSEDRAATLREGMLLTPDASSPGDQLLNVRSQAWFVASKPRLRDGFDARFRFRIRAPGGGWGSGFAFVLQDESPSARGFELGYAGIERSVAIEFDTYGGGGDYARCHVSLQSNGAAPNSADREASLHWAWLPSIELADGSIHEARIAYRPGWIEVFLDDFSVPVLSGPLDLANVRGADLLDAEGQAWVGFTGEKRTSSSERYEILSWAFRPFDWSSEAPGQPSGHWPLDDGTGPQATDVSGGGHDGSLVPSGLPGPLWSQGRVAGALRFNGVDQFVSFGTGPALSGTTDFSIAAWIRTSTSTEGVVLQQRNGGYDGEYRLSVQSDGRLRFLVFGGGDYQFEFDSDRVVNDGEWHHVAAVRDGSEGRLYIDGIPAGAESGPVRPLDPTLEVAMGADIRDGNAYFEGYLDDVRLYASALSPSQVAYLARSRRIAVATSGTGQGHVASVPPGIECGVDCAEDVTTDWSGRLVAIPAAGSRFVRWTGACWGTEETCMQYDWSSIEPAIAEFAGPDWPTSPVAHWPLDDGTGIANGVPASDISGHGHDGLITGCLFDPGRFGAAVRFGTSGSRITFGTGPSLSGTTDFTVAAWIRKSTTGEGVVLQQRNGGFVGQYQLKVDPSGRPAFLVYGSGGYQFDFSAPIVVTDGSWHHLAAVRQGSVGRIYVDGVLRATATGTIQALSSAIAVAVGADIRDNNKEFNGTIDDVRIYDEALTAAQIAFLVTGQVPPPPVPDGAQFAGAPMIVSKSGSGLLFTWDDDCQGGGGYAILSGPLGSGFLSPVDATCPSSSPATWSPPPGASSWFLIASRDTSRQIEGSWGSDSDGFPIAPGRVSGFCQSTLRVEGGSCP